MTRATPATLYETRPPYRPFLTGPPAFKTGLKKLTLEQWLRPDPELERGRAHGAAMLDERFGDVFRAETGSETVQAEALRLIETALGETAPESNEPDLARARRLVSDDLVLMVKTGGEWRCIVLALCQPTFFSAAHAFRKTLDELHVPVLRGSPQLAGAIGMIFDRLEPGAAFERFNWTIQCGGERYTPDGAPLRERAAALGPDKAARELRLRVERQTVRALPESGAVLFTIRIALDPLSEVMREEENRAAIIRGWREASDDARGYKRWAALDPAMEALFTT